jgi:hypothetical protein
MLNFLLQKNKNMIVLEYILRIVVFLLFFIFAAIIFLITLFTPSFFIANSKNITIKNQLEITKQQNLIKGEDPIVFIKNVNRLASALSEDNTGAGYSDIINKITSLKNKNITISSISINVNGDTANSKKIEITGIAKTRDSLTKYEKDVETDGFFDSISIPVSYFIQDTNSDFSATLIYNKK